MGYYTRVLATAAECVSIETLRQALEARLPERSSTSTTILIRGVREQIMLLHRSGLEIAAIERSR